MIKVPRSVFVLLLLAVPLLLNGCAGMDVIGDLMSGIGEMFSGDDDNADPPAALSEDFQAEIEVDLLWKETVGKGADQKNLKLLPAIGDGRVYVADHSGLLQARSAATGDLFWEVETGNPFATGPGLGKEVLVLGTSHGEVMAYGYGNGALKWSTTVSSEVQAVPVISKGKVVIRTTDGKIIALKEESGEFLWIFEYSVPALSIRGASTPLVSDNVLYIGNANGKLFALQLADGKSLWESTVVIPSGRSEVERLVDLDADPTEGRGTIYVSSYQGGTSAVSESDGEVIWRNENVSSYTGISRDYRYLYISDTHSEIWQLDQRNGASLWKQTDLHNRQVSAAMAYENYVVAGDYEGYVHWMSSTDGRLLARVKISKAAIEAKPVIIDGIVFAYAKDGVLAALRVK